MPDEVKKEAVFGEVASQMLHWSLRLIENDSVPTILIGCTARGEKQGRPVCFSLGNDRETINILRRLADEIEAQARRDAANNN